MKSRSAPGRRDYFRHPLPGPAPSRAAERCGAGGEAFVKVYARRKAHNLLRRLRAGRSTKEAAGFQAFRDAHIPTVELVAWGEERRSGLWNSGLIATRFVDAPNLFQSVLATGSPEPLREATAFLASIHRQGLVHGDAGLTNFLPGPSGLLALDLSDWRPATPDACLRDAARMAGSALAAGLGPDAADQVLEWYLMARGKDAGEPVRVSLDRFHRDVRRFAFDDASRLFEAKPIGSRRSHDTLSRLLDLAPPGKVLDAPCGEGVLAEFLRVRGWDVHCADIDPAICRLHRSPVTPVDLNRTLPFEAASFDAVVCANALHRLFNPAGAVGEFHRILRPGGRLYLNLNNYATLSKRLRFLLYGSLDNALNDGGCQQTIDAPEAHVRFALLMPQLLNMLQRSGFVVEGVYPAARDRSAILGAPFTWLVRAAATLVPPKSRNRNHLAIANSPSILSGGRYAVVAAIKP